MIKLLGAAGDRILSRFVPKVNAAAYGCTCSGFFQEDTWICSGGVCTHTTCVCNGCFLSCTSHRF